MAKPRITSKNKKRVALTFGVILLLMSALMVRMAWIQIVMGEEYTEKAITQQTSDIPLSAKRGDIYDRNGKEMATSVNGYSVWIWPKRLASSNQGDKYDEAVMKIAAILDMNSEQLKRKIDAGGNLVRISSYVTKADAEKIKKLDIAGVETAEATKRYYPLGTSAAHLLGSVSEDNEGRTGIEAEFEGYLSGVAGRWVHDIDAVGNTLSYGNKRYYQQKDGYSATLTIDEVLQHYAEKAIKNCADKYKTKRVQLLAMDPKTGDVLAMATYPTFDPNNATQPTSKTERKKFAKLSSKKQSKYLSRMWRNPIVSDLYEPGSTFKLVTTSSALEEGVTNLKDKFNDTGSIKVGGTVLHCWNKAGHGKQTLIQAVGNSCNPVQVELVKRMGADTYYSYLEMFGITEKTGIDLPDEQQAMILDKDHLMLVELATMSFGQGIALTPLQLLAAECSIGNDGVMMKPRIVKKLTDENGKTIKTFKTEEVRKVISSKTANEMRKVMEYVVAEGGGGTAKITGYRIGGKTGTANKAENGRYTSETWSSFVGMAPMDDPKIAVLVVADSPKGAIYGSVVSAPYAKQFLEEALPYMGIDPVYTKEEKKRMSSGVVYVPDVVNMTADNATGRIKGLGLKCEVSPEEDRTKNFGVVAQYPAAGTKLEIGDTVYIYSK